LKDNQDLEKGYCADNIFILKQLIQKHRELNHELHLLFIDYVKAFDRVD
jgi:hypothetical protein